MSRRGRRPKDTPQALQPPANIRIARNRGLGRPSVVQWFAQHRAACRAAFAQFFAHRIGSAVNVLVPGQVVSKDILDFLIAIDVKEIHGYREDLGLRVFNGHALGRQRTGTAMGGMRISGNGASASTQGPSAKKVSTHERGRSREKK